MKFFLLLVLTLSSFLVGKAQLYEVSFDEKLNAASLIVEGKIVAQKSFFNPMGTFIFTAHQIEVYKVFKGSITPTIISVLTQGGTVGEQSLFVSDNLELDLGHIGVFFCALSGTKLRSPLDNELVYDVYSDIQGFIQYDLSNFAASAPFVKYSDIANELYQSLQNKLGQQYRVVNSAFEIGKLRQKQLQRGPEALAITSFAPATVRGGTLNDVANNVLTINGTDFGVATGSARVEFDDPNDGEGGTFTQVAFNSELIVSWTNTQIQVKVPTRAGTGFIRVVDQTGATVTSTTKLNILFNITTYNFGSAPIIRMHNLANRNGSGGYNFLYSTSTANGGADFSTAPERAPFDRCIKTLREIIGANFINTGTTATQTVNAADAENIITLDNFTNTGATAYLPSGVLGRAYTSANTGGCTLPHAFATGFDVCLRRSGVSGGTSTFNNGPCYTASNTASDMETVCLHEMGHVLGLGHINDIHEGSFLPNVNPAKVMNYFILSGTDRRNPDYAMDFGGKWSVNPKGINFSSCTQAIMTPLAVVNEPLDDCPATFPTLATATNTVVNFDLLHATTNRFQDPQYTNVFTNGTGTGISNNAFYAFRARRNGTLNLAISNLVTTPASQQSCTNTGVEISIYQVNSCPAGQAFPTPIFYSSFNANSAVSNVTVPSLVAGQSYLMHVDGVNNAAASFTMTFLGSALAIKIKQFSGSQQFSSNLLNWEIFSDGSLQQAELELSFDGKNFQPIKYINGNPIDGKLIGNYIDPNNSLTKYYRLRLKEQDGETVYSNVVLLQGKETKNSISVFPNPTKETLNVFVHANEIGLMNLIITDMLGRTCWQQQKIIGQTGLQTLTLTIPKQLKSGTYILKVNSGRNMQQIKFLKE